MRAAIAGALVLVVAATGCDSRSSSQPSGCEVFTPAYRDADADGRGDAGGAQVARCAGDPAPAGYSFTFGDCDDADATRWEIRTAFRDADGDGRGGAAETVCGGSAPPSGYLASGDDCDDSDAARFRGFVRYPDADGDGVGASPRDVPCVGEPGAEPLPGAGFSVFGWDPDDGDPLVTDQPEEDDPLRPLAVR
jgi:hypothetical protein